MGVRQGSIAPFPDKLRRNRRQLVAGGMSGKLTSHIELKTGRAEGLGRVAIVTASNPCKVLSAFDRCLRGCRFGIPFGRRGGFFFRGLTAGKKYQHSRGSENKPHSISFDPVSLNASSAACASASKKAV